MSRNRLGNIFSNLDEIDIMVADAGQNFSRQQLDRIEAKTAALRESIRGSFLAKRYSPVTRDVVRALESGKTPRQNLTKQQLAAYKAHMTMGTYSRA